MTYNGTNNNCLNVISFRAHLYQAIIMDSAKRNTIVSDQVSAKLFEK